MIIIHWMIIVGCWQVPSRSMVKAAKAIRHQINLVARALNGRDDLEQVLQEITEDLDRCKIDKRRKRPNTFQLLLESSLQPTDLVVSGGLILKLMPMGCQGDAPARLPLNSLDSIPIGGILEFKESTHEEGVNEIR
jgi:hypothetical protein